MTYFLSTQALRVGEIAELTGGEAHHAAGTRRLRPGETFALQAPDGTRFRVAAEGGGPRLLRVKVLEEIPVPPLPAVQVTLIQAAVKAKAMEWILQKAAELGVARIVCFPGEHSAVALKELRHDVERGRWEKILWEACKQCDRQFPPALQVAEDLTRAIAWAGAASRSWLFHPGAGEGAAAFRGAAGGFRETEAKAGDAGKPSARLLIGPEGGLTSEELRHAWDAGFEAFALGELVLRAETAAVAACALALYA